MRHLPRFGWAGALGTIFVVGCSGAAGQGSPESSTEPVTTNTGTTTATTGVTDDAFASSEYPTLTTGTLSYLKVGAAGSNSHHAFLKLTAAGIPTGATDIVAKLGLHSLTTSSNTVTAHC